MTPSVIGTSPSMAFKKMDLPEPTGPTAIMKLDGVISIVRFCRTGFDLPGREALTFLKVMVLPIPMLGAWTVCAKFEPFACSLLDVFLVILPSFRSSERRNFWMRSKHPRLATI